MAPVLGFWDIRDFAEAIRCLLHHTGTEFEDKRYTFGPSPEFSSASWSNVKPNLGLDFPNLQYYIDIKLTQSVAILRHLGRKHGLAPFNSEKELDRMDMAEQQIMDLFTGIIELAYNEKFETMKEAYIQSLPEKLSVISKFLGTHTWILGEKLSYVDFLFHEVLENHKFLDPAFLESFSSIKEYIQRFESLPNVAKYIKSKQFKNWPLYGPTAPFGGGRDPPTH